MRDILELKPNIIIGDNYKGQVTLSSWVGFQNRQGFYGAKDSDENSNGLVKVFITGREVDYVKISTQEQINSISFLHNNSDKIRDAILDELLKELPEIKKIYKELVPDINSIDDFKKVLGLSIIHIMNSDKDGFAYIGYELGCDWDGEHGIGIMMYKERVIEIGQAPVSFNTWVTYKDNGTLNQEQENWKIENNVSAKQNNSKDKNPWWKFW